MNDEHHGSPPAQPNRRGRRRLKWAPLALVVGALVAGPALVQAGPSDETLSEGAAVYNAVCSSCHQPGGAGLEGQFPPLIDNPHVDDAAYVEDVIRNGLTGPIEVNGVTYDSVMPAQSTLSDGDIDAVIAYIQSGFAAPAVEGGQPETTGPVAGTELPEFADMLYVVAMLIALGGILLVLGPRIVGAHDRRTMPWLDAWLKTGVIVVATIFFTTWVPAKVLEFDAVIDLPREAQDLIASGLWIAGLVGCLWALWYAHREERI